MRVTLIYPPNRNVPGSPYGALPLLAGCLGGAGHAAHIVDVNLEVFERLLQRETVDLVREQFDAQWNKLRSMTSLKPHEARFLQAMAELAVVPFERLYEAEQAGRELRDPELFADPRNVNHAYDTIANLLRTVYALNPVYYPLKPGALDEFFGHLESDFDNPISRIVESVCLDQVLATQPDLVAVCIPFNEQLVEGFAFLKQLKRRAPHVKTIVGGAIVSAYHDKLCADPRFYQYADFGMPGEADNSLHEFCTALEQGGDLKACANLWHRDETGAIQRPPRLDLPNLNEIGTPDFSTVAVGRYFLPYTIANYQTSRGCYYGKCTFCSFDIKANFRFRKAELVTQDIEHIQRQTGLKHFIFWDPLTPPRLMKAISRWNKDRGEERIWWGAETKFEKTFTNPEFTQLLSDGGCKFLQFGFESGSQRMLDLMVKGNDLSRVDLMLDALRNSDVAVSVQWFIGFPGATELEDRSSYQYLHEHRDSVVMSSYMGTFTLSPDDDIYRSGGDLYDVDIFQNPDGSYDYTHRDGKKHYDRQELHAAYMARGDMESITRMAFYIYLTDHPEKVREVSNFERGGALPDTWDDLKDTAPEMPKANYLAQYDFDIFTPPEQQGLTEAGGRLPAKECHAIFVTQTQLVYPLTQVERRMIELCDGARTANEIVAELGGDVETMQRALLRFVRRGLLRIPLPAWVAASGAA